jgi:dihydrofolate reductase
MANLVFTANTSLDGYIEDGTGNFDWAAPSEELHQHHNDRERASGTYLYGRKLYETMRVWETWGTPDKEPVVRDFAQLWQAAEKIIYSTTLGEVTTARTRIARTFDPDAVRAMKASVDRPISIGGPGLAAHAFRAGLIDEIHLYLCPIIIGGGNPALPDGVRLDLELVSERTFDNGVVHHHYRAIE